MQVQSRHFNLSSPLNVTNHKGTGGSELQKHLMGLRNQGPGGQPRKEVFFKSGNGQGLRKMTLGDTSRSGDISVSDNVTDFKNMTGNNQTYLQQINENPQQRKMLASFRRKQSEDINDRGANLNSDLKKTSFGKNLRVAAHSTNQAQI